MGWNKPLTAAAIVATLMTAGGCHGTNTSEAAATSGLADSRWLAEAIDGQAVATGSQSTLEFQGSDMITGSTGCNRYSGPVTIIGDSFRVGALVTTRRACPPPRMSQEQRFTEALAASQRYRLDGTSLLLLDATGAERLRLGRSTGSG